MMIPFSPHSIEGALDFSNTTVFKFNALIKPEININSYKQLSLEPLIYGWKEIGKLLNCTLGIIRHKLKRVLLKGRYVFFRLAVNSCGTISRVYCTYKSLLALFIARYCGLDKIPEVPCILIIGTKGISKFLGVSDEGFRRKYRDVFESDGIIYKLSNKCKPYLCAFTNMLIASLVKHPELDFREATYVRK